MTVYFDLDGTLIDSSIRHKVLLEKILNEKSSSYNEILVNQYLEYKRTGKNTFEFLTNILKLDKMEAIEIGNEWKRNIEKDQYLELDVLYNETIDVLNLLKNNNVEIAYISARMNKEGTLQQLQRLNIAEYSNNIYIVNNQNACENKYNAISQYVVNEDVVVGDTEADYYLGKRLGVPTLILNRGFRNKEYWDNLGVVSYGHILPTIKMLIRSLN